MLNPKVAVKNGGIQGTGLFAIAEIAPGELIWHPEPDLPRFPESIICSWSPEKQARFFKYSIQVDEGTHMGYEDGLGSEAWTYLNHSCDPSAWWDRDVTLVARHRIRRGEEITFDYSSTEIRTGFGLKTCDCRSPLCRHAITGHDYRDDPALRERYGDHVLPHVLRTAAQPAT